MLCFYWFQNFAKPQKFLKIGLLIKTWGGLLHQSHGGESFAQRCSKNEQLWKHYASRTGPLAPAFSRLWNICCALSLGGGSGPNGAYVRRKKQCHAPALIKSTGGKRPSRLHQIRDHCRGGTRTSSALFHLYASCFSFNLFPENTSKKTLIL